ncbi:MAG: molecular chaperone DnaJ [Pseudomonadales bacterium]
MIPRIVLGAILAIALFWLLRTLLRKQHLNLRQFFAIYIGLLLVVALVYLGLTGRLHPLAAGLGVVMAVLSRMLPMGLRLFQAMNIWRSIKAAMGVASARAGPNPGGQSQIKSRYLAMSLDHDSGQMDGEILDGAHKGKTLSSLALEDLLMLREDISDDIDSLQLLEAYLERVHPDWQQTNQSKDRQSKGMSEHEALKTLGLKTGCTKGEIVQAHRRLMQQHHPDRGGSNQMAARLNAAKETLLRGR